MSETPRDMPFMVFGMCDTCDKPATHWARDIVLWANHATGHLDGVPVGNLKRGCDEHKVVSVKHEAERLRP